ncbi:MAG: hypothetical protein SGJ11_17025 [Phycisphaerae bacterium]|nr:hypothetical protein [Phycisphaerae bacterium]
MTMDGHDLLRRLEPAVRPMAAPSFGVRVDSVGVSDFESLLARARGGTIESGRAVQDAALGTPLPLEARERIGRALDLLESRGVDTAAIFYGGRLLIADVRQRTFEREVLAHEPSVPIHVDVALRVPTGDEQPPSRVQGPPHALRIPVPLPDPPDSAEQAALS